MSKGTAEEVRNLTNKLELEQKQQMQVHNEYHTHYYGSASDPKTGGNAKSLDGRLSLSDSDEDTG